MPLSVNFKGLVVPVLTPIINDDKKTLNLSVIPQYAQYLLQKGIKGILVNGTTGEGPSLSLQERKSITEAWVDAVKTTKQYLMVQIGGCPLPDVLELAKQAELLKVDSLLCLPELYFKPSNSQEVIDYLKIVGVAAPNTPLLYYHIPMLTNVNINVPNLLKNIGNQVPTFSGVKFTSSVLEEAVEAVNVQNKKYAVFLGNDQIITAGFVLGIDSVIATSINLFPELVLGIVNDCQKGNWLEAKEKQEQLTQAVTTISKFGTWVETMKAAMNLLTNVNVGPVRPPLKPLAPEAITALAKDLQVLGFDISLNI
ncbi:N-acetylneuraminate lyase-like [Prorops nasuta]|uniref:N-acetylneuraminate lyase-like n=1 Tax=Prorops nasuta TaxID=863751 RepID=UPI0034CD1A22